MNGEIRQRGTITLPSKKQVATDQWNLKPNKALKLFLNQNPYLTRNQHLILKLVCRIGRQHLSQTWQIMVTLTLPLKRLTSLQGKIFCEIWLDLSRLWSGKVENRKCWLLPSFWEIARCGGRNFLVGGRRGVEGKWESGGGIAFGGVRLRWKVSASVSGCRDWALAPSTGTVFDSTIAPPF